MRIATQNLLLIFIVPLTSCTSFYNNDTGYTNAIVVAAAASPQQLEELKPVGSTAKDCELEQRMYVFLADVPAIHNWIEINQLWMNKVYQKNHRLRDQNTGPISPCIKDPYLREPANEKEPNQ